MNLPLTMLEPNRETLEYAREIAMLSNVTYDSLHAALVAQNNINVVVSEDISDWGRILRAWPKIKRRFKTEDLIIVSPARGVIRIE